MSITVFADNMNRLLMDSSKELLEKGNYVNSRNGDSYELEDVDLILTEPKNRNLYLKGRGNNIFASIAETLWVLSGSDEIDPFLSFFLPRAENYSDDGETWRGAYGHRLYQHEQLQSVIDNFAKNKNTRHCCMSIWQPEYDTNKSIRDVYGLDNTKDRPCSSMLWFWIRDDELKCKFQMRSNDIVFGFSHINVFEWSFLQEIVFYILKYKYPELELGYFHHSVISFHAYQFSINRLHRIHSNEKNEEYVIPRQNYNVKLSDFIIENEGYEEKSIKKMFDIMINGEPNCSFIPLSTLIEKDIPENFSSVEETNKMFADLNITTIENQLYFYVLCVYEFIRAKKTNSYMEFSLEKTQSFPKDLLSAISVSNFTNFEKGE